MSGEVDDGQSGEMSRADALQQLHISFTSTRRARPPHMEFPGESVESRVPLKVGRLSQRESKGGLRGMFTRNKVDKNVVLSVLEEPPATAISENRPAIAEKTLPRSDYLKRVNTLPARTPTPSTPKATSKPSRMNLRSKSLKHTKPTPRPSPKSSTKSSPKPPTRTSAAWDPPPLFQAYPQAIKHATLLASTLSADSILRISNHKRTNSLRDEFAQSRPAVSGPEQSAAAKKAEKVKSKHRRQISGSISKADWTEKIFVLVTSGYLLQYAGEGSFDRLPEKMMQLGKDSVAFASDVIPGKHWVLQISQSMNADGTPTVDSRSLLSRLAFRGADYRRTATSLLLVLNGAEDMDSWIAVVRREIEALGGKKHVSETGKPKLDDRVMQLKAQPSHRYLVQRDPDQFSNPASPSSPSFGPPPWTEDVQLQDKVEDAASAPSSPLSKIRPSTGHQSIANSVMSHDGCQLENLRDSANRLSFMSSGQRTLITSQSSSTTSSPVRESYPSFDDFPPKISVEDSRPRPNAAAVNERRRSMQTMHIAVLDTPPPPKNHRHSTFTMPIRPPSSHSVAPNFSTPKRLSRVLIPETPPIPTIITMPTAANPRDSSLKGMRRGPPAALNVTRPLSPVEDSPSPNKPAPISAPLSPSFSTIQQPKSSMISIPPGSPSPTTPISPVDLHRRKSSLMPVETAHLDFQFPKRISSMQNLHDTPSAPLRPAPLPPGLTTPLPVSPYSFKHNHDQQEECERERETLSPLPILANSKQKLRRPNSMQIRPSATSPLANTRPPRTSLVSPNQRLSTGSSSPASIAVISPSFQRLQAQAQLKAVGNRKSMPALVNGPPLAPPPDCALPPLPPEIAGFRGSVRV